MDLTIRIKTIPHDEQRYDTAGDWLWNADNTLLVAVSDLGNPRMNLLVGLHEAVEAILCQQAGVTAAMVDDWDMEYERQRPVAITGGQTSWELPCGCQIDATSEPGDDIHCPCYRQHQAASVVEQLLAMVLEVNWAEYERKIEEL